MEYHSNFSTSANRGSTSSSFSLHFRDPHVGTLCQPWRGDRNLDSRVGKSVSHRPLDLWSSGEDTLAGDPLQRDSVGVFRIFRQHLDHPLMDGSELLLRDWLALGGVEPSSFAQQ